jgi:hypothetical protein
MRVIFYDKGVRPLVVLKECYKLKKMDILNGYRFLGGKL